MNLPTMQKVLGSNPDTAIYLYVGHKYSFLGYGRFLYKYLSI